MSFQSRNLSDLQRKIVSKTFLSSRSDKQENFAWNRHQTEWNIVHRLLHCCLRRLAYNSIPLDPARTRHIFNFSESRLARSVKLNTDETILMPDTLFWRSHTFQLHAEITQSHTLTHWWQYPQPRIIFSRSTWAKCHRITRKNSAYWQDLSLTLVSCKFLDAESAVVGDRISLVSTSEKKK